MGPLLFFATILCNYVVPALSSSDSAKASGIPFRFHLAPERLPNQTYRVLSGSVPAAEAPRAFWPVEKGAKETKKIQNVLGPYTELSIPNPFQEPLRCVQSTNAYTTWLCDPDMLLSFDEQANIESKLLRIRDRTVHKCSDGLLYSYQIAVVVVSSVAVSPANENPQEAAHKLAEKLLRRWGIGNKNCHDGMLLLFATNQNVASLVLREGVEKAVLSKQMLERIENRIKASYFATRDANTAILNGLSLIDYELPVSSRGFTAIAIIVIGMLVLFFTVSGLLYIFCFWLATLGREE